MKEELINFETAKLAMKCGLICYDNGCFDENGKYFKSPESLDIMFNRKSVKYSCVTQSLLQKQLREQHNIDIIITPFTAGKADKKRWEWLEEGKKYYYYNVHSRHGIHLDEIKEQFCNIFEESLEKALQRSLKLINK
jgi:hypothetical protein